MSNHRYILRRSWLGEGGVVNFIMLNPSTADDVFDDATIRRCCGFAKRWGFSGLVVTNLFAYRATQPKDLMKLVGYNAGLAIGDENEEHLNIEAKNAKAIVCAWGDNCDVLPHRDLSRSGNGTSPKARNSQRSQKAKVAPSLRGKRQRHMDSRPKRIGVCQAAGEGAKP